MKQEDFEKSIERQISYVKKLLLDKGIEYDRHSSDRLEYFKEAAALMGITPKEALAGMMIKHTISIYTMCHPQVTYSTEKWTEKITDHINYLLLLKALIDEENEEV